MAALCAALMFRKNSWFPDSPGTRKTIRLPSAEMVTPRSNVKNEKALLSKVVKGMSKRTTGMLVDGDFDEKLFQPNATARAIASTARTDATVQAVLSRSFSRGSGKEDAPVCELPSAI